MECSSFSLTGEFGSGRISQYWVSGIPFLWELYSLQWSSRLWIFSAHVANHATEATGDTVVECQMKREKACFILFKGKVHHIKIPDFGPMRNGARWEEV